MEKVATYYLNVLAQIKTLHWFTHDYTAHVRLGELYDTLSDEVDGLIEALIGARKLPRVSPPRLRKDVINLLEDLIEFTESLGVVAAARASVDNISFIATKYIYLLSME